MTSAQKQRLGKGLEALIPTPRAEGETERPHTVLSDVVLAAGRTVVNVPVSDIIPNPRQPRGSINPETLKELADSIREQGVVQPVLVRRQGDRYELVAGERRWRAATQAGFTMIPAIVKNFSDVQALEIALIENIQREDLNAMDEAEAYHRLMNEFQLTQEVVAQKVGKSRPTVANAVRLTELPDEVKSGIREGKVTAGHVRPLLSLPDQGEQLRIYREILETKLNVRDVEFKVAERRTLRPGIIRRRVIAVHPELLDVLNILLDYFGTKVKISGTPKRGRIMLEYFSQEDLERLIELLTGKKIAERFPKEVTEVAETTPAVSSGETPENSEETLEETAEASSEEKGVSEGEMHSLVDAGQ